ncbi:539_t:CDS:10 [Entrophospora sp. SA101]|nr:539_t:CDS:10 [Entrophospora sp. SA101]CAJ0900309.1 4911_t:CDS:10 [Entrophospora sp. SA101]CAJ0925609.1 9049_t:CDS:10 [Entrophospora sp. SA101]
MPPKSKKKKKPANPARGFATKSTPSKIKDTETTDDNESINKTNEEENLPMVVESVNDQEAIEEEDKEDKFLISLIDKLKHIDEKKVDRYFKELSSLSSIELNNFDDWPILSLDSNIEHKIIEHLQKVENHEDYVNTNDVEIRSTKDYERMISELDIVYMTLLRLGFKQIDIEKCIKTLGKRTKLKMNVNSTNFDNLLSEKTQEDDDDNEKLLTEMNLNNNKHSNKLKHKNLSNPSYDYNKEEESDDPNVLYAEFKYELIIQQKYLKTLNKSSEVGSQKEIQEMKELINKINKTIQEINSQINLVKEDYFFSLNEAEKLFNELNARKNLDQEVEQLFQMYNFKFTEDKEEEAEREKMKKAEASSEEVEVGDEEIKAEKDVNDDDELHFDDLLNNHESNDLFDDIGDNENLLSGLLEIPTNNNQQNNNINLPNNIVSKLRDMSYSNWVGQSPKEILSEFCRKKDRNVKISFGSIPNNNSSIQKAFVKIDWSNTKDSNFFSMKDREEGCRTKDEAFNYVSTLALIELTNNQPLYLRLPIPYKELWLEIVNDKELSIRNSKYAIEKERMKFLVSVLDDNNNNKAKSSSINYDIIKDNKDSNVEISALNYLKTKSNIITQVGISMRQEFIERRKKNYKIYERINSDRQKLPIYKYRNEILKKIEENQVVIICGETGCGKSTQVPQLIVEDMILNDYGDKCQVLCTQPRRISAISISTRVSYELGDPPNSIGTNRSLVGYQIRLESRTSKSNVLKFCTNVVHERSLESDFLLIILKNLLTRRPDLKIILMSATVESNKFSQYFHQCPIIEVPGRTFPVKVKYLEDIIEATKYTLDEDDEFAKKADKSLILADNENAIINIGRKKNKSKTVKIQMEDFEDGKEYSDSLSIPDEALESYSTHTIQMLNRIDEYLINYDLIIIILKYICINSSGDNSENLNINIESKEEMPLDGSILIFLPGMPEIRRLHDQLISERYFNDENKFLIYPLHSLISSENQGMVFEDAPNGVRKIILSTNIAETGITIPDVTIVIDTGKVNRVRYNESKKITNLQEMFISKANAKQRRGRAGRVKEGLCFHLFTKWRFEYKMSDYELPEIMRLPLQDLCLKIKVCGLGNISDVLSEALDKPNELAIQNAISTLQEVQALTSDEKLTPLGTHLSHLPVDVHIGKMLLFGSIFKCLDPILTIASILSHKSPFSTPFGRESEADKAKSKFNDSNSDLLTMYKAYIKWREYYEKFGGFSNETRDFCHKNFLNIQNLMTIEDLKKQFLSLLVDIGFVRFEQNADLKFLSRNNRKLCKMPLNYNAQSNSYSIINAAIVAGLYPKILYYNSKNKELITIINNDQKLVNIHPSSINFHTIRTSSNSTIASKFFVYNTMIKTNKVYVRDTSAFDVIDLHEKKALILDKFIKLQCPAKTASLLKYLRFQLNKILKYRIDYPAAELNSEQEQWLDLTLDVIKSTEAEN